MEKFAYFEVNTAGFNQIWRDWEFYQFASKEFNNIVDVTLSGLIKKNEKINRGIR